MNKNIRRQSTNHVKKEYWEHNSRIPSDMQNNFDALELPQNEKNMACAIHHKEFLLSAEA